MTEPNIWVISKEINITHWVQYRSCPDNNSQNDVFKPFIPLVKFFYREK